jgi:DNA-directed RNA polymerase specialized sigma24 family protein
VDLVTLASALLSNKSDAEDVVHDVFVTLLRSAWKFRLTGSLKGFLATCVANRARNRNKAGRRQIGNADSLENFTMSARLWPHCRTNSGRWCCFTCAGD